MKLGDSEIGQIKRPYLLWMDPRTDEVYRLTDMASKGGTLVRKKSGEYLNPLSPLQLVELGIGSDMRGYTPLLGIGRLAEGGRYETLVKSFFIRARGLKTESKEFQNRVNTFEWSDEFNGEYNQPQPSQPTIGEMMAGLISEIYRMERMVARRMGRIEKVESAVPAVPAIRISA